MKIGFFIINNIVGGGGMVATQDAINMLASMGYEICIFMECIKTDDKLHLLTTKSNVKYVECGSIKEYMGIERLVRCVKSENIDIFVTHCHYYLPIIQCFPTIKSLGVKIILNEHHLHFIPIYEKRYELYVEREKYLRSVDLITVIEKSSYYIWKSLGYKVAYLPNTINNLEEVSLCEKKNNIIISGRFTDFKQIELGVLAFSLIAKKYKNWNLIILGKGSRLKSIRRTIANVGIVDQVKLIGWTKNPEKYFSEASIHILPSYTEPFGLVIVDAKKNKIPTVMFDIKSNELVRNGIDGFKVPMNDVEKMSDKIEYLIRHKKTRQLMGNVAINNVAENKPSYTSKVWDEIIQFTLGKAPRDLNIFNKHFNIKLSEEGVSNLVGDYDQLLKWMAYNLSDNGKNTAKINIRQLFQKSVNYFGNYIFNFVSKHFSADRIVLWDSNRVGQIKESLKNIKFPLKTVEIVPNGFLTPRVAWNLARSKVFITNTNTGIIKRLQTKYNGKSIVINVWHGAGYFKKFGVQEADIGIGKFKEKYGTPDYVLCSSENIQEKYASIFALPKNSILPFGCLRSDLLLDEDYRKSSLNKFYGKFPSLKNKKIYLFAPTWRGEPFKGETAEYYFAANIRELKNRLKDDEVCLIKNHQLVIKSGKTNISNADYDNKFINVDDFPMSILLFVATVVITDFSSLLFEALILNKPILMWASDVNVYKQKIGFYDDYEKYIPGEFYDGNDSEVLLKCIRNSSDFVGTEKYLSIKSYFVNSCDGNVANRLGKFVSGLDLTNYKKRWTKYIRRIGLAQNYQPDLQKFWNKNFVKIFINNFNRKIHYELISRDNGKHNKICFHVELPYSINEQADVYISAINEFEVKKGNNFFEISKATNFLNVRDDFKKIEKIVEGLSFKFDFDDRVLIGVAQL